MFHPIQRFRAMRRRSKVAASGVFAVLLAGGVALAAVLLTSSAPITGNAHNGSWTATVTAATIVPDSGSITGGNDPAGSVFTPSDTSPAVYTALGCSSASGCSIPNDTSEGYACGGASFVAGDTTNKAGFKFTDGSGALPGDTCYMDISVTMPSTNAANTYLDGLTMTGLPSGWVAFIDGGGGAASKCSTGTNPLASMGTAKTVHIPVAVVAGVNADVTDNTVHQITGSLTFGGSRAASHPAGTASNCEVVSP